MHTPALMEREITPQELAIIRQDFAALRTGLGIPPVAQRRLTLVSESGHRLIGCATGLQTENGWFYLTDLWVERSHRHQGLGSDLLLHLERMVLEAGATDIYTETAGFEAPLFYERHGYVRFFELKNFYLGGHSRLGLQKRLSPA